MKRLAQACTAQASRLAAGAIDTVLGPRLSILLLHRVLARPDVLFPGEMHVEQFDRLMRAVARAFSVLTLGQALSLLQQGRLPRRAMVISFDDGYANNAELALPILKRHGLVASFFVSTGFLDGGRMWNDTVVETLRLTSRARVDLSDFGLGEFLLDTPEQRRRAIDALLPRIKYMSLSARQQALGRLQYLAGAPRLPDDLMMRSAQVVQLQRSGMEIGGHTVHHPILKLLPDAESRAEIADGRAHLQALVDAPVDVFAYPNGRPRQDYDARHVEMLRQLGFRGAVCTATGAATAAADLFQLPRSEPWQQETWRWAGHTLAERLRAAHREAVAAAV